MLTFNEGGPGQIERNRAHIRHLHFAAAGKERLLNVTDGRTDLGHMSADASLHPYAAVKQVLSEGQELIVDAAKNPAVRARIIRHNNQPGRGGQRC